MWTERFRLPNGWRSWVHLCNQFYQLRNGAGTSPRLVLRIGNRMCANLYSLNLVGQVCRPSHQGLRRSRRPATFCLREEVSWMFWSSQRPKVMFGCTKANPLEHWIKLLWKHILELGGPPFVSPVSRGLCRPKNRHSVLPIIQLPILFMFHLWFPTQWIRFPFCCPLYACYFPPLRSLVSHLQSSLQALLHEELSEVKRRRAALRAELRAASKEDRKLRKRRANLVKAYNSCIRACLAVLACRLVCVAVRFQSQFWGAVERRQLRTFHAKT